MVIEINISKEEIEKCSEFAKKAVSETYNRFNQNKEVRIKRIFFGKLGELVFLRYLNNLSIYPNIKGMFDIYPGITNVDAFDFLTKDGEKIDIKTAYEPNHIRILIPYDQFENNKAKDYYVGIKVDLNNSKAFIFGFCDKKTLETNEKIDFGEGSAYWEYLDKLRPIPELITLF